MSGDEESLRALNERYFHGLDLRDLDVVGRTFRPDASAEYLDGEWVMSGRAEIVEKLRTILRFRSSIHLVASASYTVHGDDASGVVFAIATLAVDEPGPAVLVRGLRYTDTYRRDAHGWAYVHRCQQVLWQYDQPGVTPSIAPGS
ncbi:nuclear transport factor 2 family protein [Pseudonocardia pini]|uniref:nuclear transport factor 2 family protein n=1 Tax=Pseudonocardia pini TaxID=2758030 RepID=UPI0015F02D44|nr:nuclear transport factor 2 family protein [Pseudonocardia pini]